MINRKRDPAQHNWSCVEARRHRDRVLCMSQSQCSAKCSASHTLSSMYSEPYIPKCTEFRRPAPPEQARPRPLSAILVVPQTKLHEHPTANKMLTTLHHRSAGGGRSPATKALPMCRLPASRPSMHASASAQRVNASPRGAQCRSALGQIPAGPHALAVDDGVGYPSHTATR
jgi:hypothetical protein